MNQLLYESSHYTCFAIVIVHFEKEKNNQSIIATKQIKTDFSFLSRSTFQRCQSISSIVTWLRFTQYN